MRYVTKTLDTMNINIIKCVTCASQWRNRVAPNQRAVTPAVSYCQHLLFYSGFVIDYFKWSVQTIMSSILLNHHFTLIIPYSRILRSLKFNLRAYAVTAYLLSLVCNFDFFDKSHWYAFHIDHVDTYLQNLLEIITKCIIKIKYSNNRANNPS